MQVEVGFDRDLALAALQLWREWTFEEYGHEFDADSWAMGMVEQAKRGGFLQLIAWDDARPVGMVECYWHYDPGARKWFGHGDHAYVTADYRGHGVFDKLFDGIMDVARILGVQELMAPAGANGFLKQMYEKHGFEVYSHIMRRAA